MTPFCRMFWLSCCMAFVLAIPSLALTAPEDPNATAQTAAKPLGDQAKPVQTPETPQSSIANKLPLDIVSKGTDQSGTLLSYRLKEELMASKLFALTASEKKKFVLHIRTQPEFADRPNLASLYSIALVYQEDPATLTYYLDLFHGQVHGESVNAEVQKILEWSYATLKRYHYLLED